MRKSFAILFFGFLCTAPEMAACAALVDSVTAKLTYNPNFGSTVQMDIRNLSNEFLCIEASVADTRAGFISVLDETGHRIPQFGNLDKSLLGMERDFDFEAEYYFLRPQKTLTLYVDMSNFRVPASREYRYEVTFGYVRCRDITETTGPIPVYPAQGDGRVFVQVKGARQGQ